jgi:hypothetical protein
MGYYTPDSQIEFCLSTFRWISLTSFCTVLRDLCIVDFDEKQTLKAARKDLIQALSSDIPSSEIRFPENGKYVCVDKPQLFGQLVQVLRMLATPDSLLTGKDIKDYFSAIVQMREMIHESQERVVFSRETFESEFDLIWCKEPSNHGIPPDVYLSSLMPPPLVEKS